MSWIQLNYFSAKLLILKNYVTTEGAVSHNVLYYQQLSIARYQVSCYAKNYFWKISNYVTMCDESDVSNNWFCCLHES